MSYKPIPRRLLIHSVEYIESDDGNSGWGGESMPESTEIKHVRFEPSTSVKKTDKNEEKLVKGVLFIDAKNSQPFIKPLENQTIIFSREKLNVQSVDTLYTNADKPHHYEVTLV